MYGPRNFATVKLLDGPVDILSPLHTNAEPFRAISPRHVEIVSGRCGRWIRENGHPVFIRRPQVELMLQILRGLRALVRGKPRKLADIPTSRLDNLTTDTSLTHANKTTDSFLKNCRKSAA